ncbi:MAG: hypothetical protein WBY94_23200 [Polyangiaceae bacterium]
MRSFSLSVAASLATVLVANVATADDKTAAAQAATLFEEGHRLMVAEDYAAACPKLTESQTIDPAPATAFELGICYQKASQAAFKTGHELASRLPDQPTGAPSIPSRTLALASGAEGLAPGQTQRAVGLSLGGAGVAAVLAGVITAAMAKSAYDKVTAECGGTISACRQSESSQYNSAMRLAAASTISLLTGAAAVGAGVVVFFTAAQSAPGAGTTVGLGPTAGGAGLSVTGGF